MNYEKGLGLQSSIFGLKSPISRGFRHHGLGLDVVDSAQFSGQGVDLVGVAFDNEGYDRDRAVAEREALAGQNDVGILGNHRVHLRCNGAVLDQHRNGSNSLFHQCNFWIR